LGGEGAVLFKAVYRRLVRDILSGKKWRKGKQTKISQDTQGENKKLSGKEPSSPVDDPKKKGTSPRKNRTERKKVVPEARTDKQKEKNEKKNFGLSHISQKHAISYWV